MCASNTHVHTSGTCFKITAIQFIGHLLPRRWRPRQSEWCRHTNSAGFLTNDELSSTCHRRLHLVVAIRCASIRQSSTATCEDDVTRWTGSASMVVEGSPSPSVSDHDVLVMIGASATNVQRHGCCIDEPSVGRRTSGRRSAFPWWRREVDTLDVCDADTVLRWTHERRLRCMSSIHAVRATTTTSVCWAPSSSSRRGRRIIRFADVAVCAGAPSQ